jgi:protocatechuate 3,4-dioxygenase beta subunit
LLVARDIGRNLVASHDINERTTNVDLSLQPGLTLSVKVQDANGQPLPSATASLALTNWDLSRTPERADEQGLIEIKALLQGRAYSATIAARGYNVARIRVPAEETETTRFEFPEVVLRAADRTLAGTVFGPDNKPFPRANVGLSGIGQSSISVGTDADGHFAFFALVEGVVRLSASARFDNDYLRAEVRAHSDDTNVVIRFTNNPAEGPRPAVVANSAMVTNAGRILDPPGAPVSGALMSIAPSFGNRIEGRSDAGGKFSVVWQARNAGGANLKHFIYVRDEGRNLAVSQDADETVTNLELRLQPGLTLSVKAQDVNGKPIPAATASLAIREGTSAFDFNQITGRADAQGLIEIKALPPGRPYTVTITAPGFSITNLQAQAADTQTTRFELPPAVLKAADLRIYGHVVTPDGKPAPEARMLLNGDGQKPANTTADSRGHFAFYSLAAGPVRLIANIEADDGRSFGGGIIAQAGDSNVLIWLGVDGINNPDLQILTTSGKVLDTSGAPVAGAGLSILPGFGASLEVKSDAGGNYSITWKNQNRTKAGVRNSFPATPYVLVAHDARHESFAAVELDGLATNVDLRLLPGFTLTGTVRATNGQPVTNAVVALVLDPPNDGRSFVNPLQTTNAGAQGSFTFSGLPQEARYCLRVSAAGYGSNSTLVSAADTRTTQLQLPAIVLKAANRQLAGRVLGLDQQPAPAAQVTMHGEGQPGFKTVSSDTNGLFVIQEICDGLVDVRAVLSSRTNNPRSLVGAVQAHGGDTNIVVQLGMTNGVPVVGTAGVMRVTTNRPPVPAPLGP